MDVLRVFNNNVVLAKDGNSEVILTGRGIGFQAKPGQHVDDAKIVRRFVPVDGKDPDHMAQQVAGIPPEIIRLVTDAMNRTGLKEQADRQPALVLALSDHICGAIRRSQNKQTIEYPLEAEVRSLYASEYAKGKALVDAMNTYLGGALPDCEAVALALHLVNAGFSTGDLSATYTMTGVIQQMRRSSKAITASALTRTASMWRVSSRICAIFSCASTNMNSLTTSLNQSWNPSKPHIRKHRIAQTNSRSSSKCDWMQVFRKRKSPISPCMSHE